MDEFEEVKPDFQQEEEVDALWISEDVRSYLYETAKWTKFLSVVGFVFSALTAITAFGASAVLNSLATVSPDNPMLKIGSSAITIIYLLLALMQFYPSFLLFKFATGANQAVLYGDQASLSAAMSKLKSFFKFWGILTILFIAFYILMMLFAVVIGMGASRAMG
jgi:hypothetical protein